MDPVVIGAAQGKASRRGEHIIEGLKKPIKHFWLVVADGVKTARRLDVVAVEPMPRQKIRRPSRHKVIQRSSKSHRIGPKVRRKVMPSTMS